MISHLRWYNEENSVYRYHSCCGVSNSAFCAVLRIDLKRLFRFSLVLCVILILIIILSGLDIIDLKRIFGSSRTSTSLLQVLKSESIVFLATDRITTFVYTDIQENNLLLGNREGLLIMKVSYIYGFDLSKLTSDSLVCDADIITVHLPDVEMLEMSPDLSSAEIYTKTSGLCWLYDQFTGQDMHEELLSQLDSVSTVFAIEEDLLPEREEIIGRLNAFAPVLQEYAGSEITFR